MARLSSPTARKRTMAISAARKQAERPAVVHSSIYLPVSVYEALRKIAFDERLKIQDLVLEGIDAALRRRGYPPVPADCGSYRMVMRSHPDNERLDLNRRRTSHQQRRDIL
jgi:hypothetical protein